MWHTGSNIWVGCHNVPPQVQITSVDVTVGYYHDGFPVLHIGSTGKNYRLFLSEGADHIKVSEVSGGHNEVEN